MKKLVMIFFTVVCSIAACSLMHPVKNNKKIAKQDEKSTAEKNENANPFPKEVNPDEYTFYFGDEFNGSKVDTAIWNRRRRLATDINSFDPNSLPTIKVSNGILDISTFKLKDGEIGSAEMSTDKHFWSRYGYFELKAQLSSGVGNSCAFWLQTPKTLVVSNPFNPAEAGVEIDIFENGISQGIDKLFYSLHWNGYNPKEAKFITFADTISGIYNGFHTFGFEWTPKKYAIYIDGKQRILTDTIISHMPECIILGIGPGSFGSNVPMFPNPSSLLVDYLHVYKRKPEVTLFGDLYYRGWVSKGLQPGSYKTEQLHANGAFSNDISSIEVPSGWKVTLYDGDNFTGESLVIDGIDVYHLDMMENKASSVKIEKNKF